VVDFTGYKNRIFSEGTLLERIVYQHFFENQNKQQALKALRAYQNSDGGFGHGLEHDVRCPSSNSVATEAALFYIDMLSDVQGSIIQDISFWVKHNIQYNGTLLPPFDFYHYPYKEWWEDDKLLRNRVLAIIGNLIRKESISKETYADKLKELVKNSSLELDLSYYSYPFYLYEYATKGSSSPAVRHLLSNIDELIEENENHYPLFSRYWYWLIPEISYDLLKKEKLRIERDIFRNINYINPYPDLDYWDLTFTLDAMIIYSKLR